MQAALSLCAIPYLSRIIAHRRNIRELEQSSCCYEIIKSPVIWALHLIV